MLRPVFQELALFATPFVLYAMFLFATRARVLDRESWPFMHVAWLTFAALLLVIGGFIALAHFGGSPPGSSYIPAHMENGRFVPGETK